MTDYVSITVDDQALVSIEDPDFGLLDGIRIEKPGGMTVVLRVRDDVTISALIANLEFLQQARWMKRRSCGHAACADASGHIDTCEVESREAQVR